MSIKITMPRLSDTMEQGTLVKWYVKEGDEVEPDTLLADIETDKATMEMPTYEAGTVAKILVQEGDTVDVGTTVLILAAEGESVDDIDLSDAESASTSTSTSTATSAASESEEESTSTATATATQESTSATAPTTPSMPSSSPATQPNGRGGGRQLVTPLARRIAEEHGLDLHSIEGSGPSGKIIKRDVLRLVDGEGAAPSALRGPTASSGQMTKVAPAPSPQAKATPNESALPVPRPNQFGKAIAMSNMRQTIARRLVESKQSIPHYQVSLTINMDPLLELRKTLNTQLESQNVKLSVNDFIIRACALAMYQHPIVNSSWRDDSIQIHEHINIGVAINLPEERGGGLVVATLRDADRMGLRQISSEVRALATKAREKGLTIDEMSDSTFTLSNLGMFDVEHFTAIINPPNSAILAVGAAVKKPVVRDNELMIGHEMTCTMSCDHRVIDGATNAQYLQTVRTLLENPAGLLV